MGKSNKDKAKKLRLDDLLIAKGIVWDKTEADKLIRSGSIVVDEQTVDKPGQQVNENSIIRNKNPKSQFVSRAGEKLLGVLEDLSLKECLFDKIVLDIGSSTGGFTDCCLQLGAKTVISVDVGTNQLAWKIRSDVRVICLEETDIRDFRPNDHPSVDWILADISFNGLARLAPSIFKASQKSGTKFLLLVKPQFELDRSQVPKGGVVISDELRNEAASKVLQAFRSLGIKEERIIDSRVTGKTGNRELFVYFESI